MAANETRHDVMYSRGTAALLVRAEEWLKTEYRMTTEKSPMGIPFQKRGFCYDLQSYPIHTCISVVSSQYYTSYSLQYSSYVVCKLHSYALTISALH